MSTTHTAEKGTGRRSRRGTWAVALAVPVGLLASGALVWQASYAAFTATTENTANSWSTGTVVLADNDGGTALWTSAGLLEHGSTATRCITVSYTGDLAATIDFSATSSGTLAPDLDVTIQTGSGTAADCSDFTGATALYTGTLAALPAGLTPLPDWTVAGAATRTYRIAWTVATTAAQGETATAAFTWTATS